MSGTKETHRSSRENTCQQDRKHRWSDKIKRETDVLIHSGLVSECPKGG